MKINDNGTIKDLVVKASDTLPIGTIVEYDGDTIPSGYEEVIDYSTEEVKTGSRWIDGKPIYRKVIHYSKPANETTSSIPFAEYPTIETIINISGMSKISSSWRMFPNLYSEDVSTYNQSIYDINETILVCYSTWYAQRAAEIYITLEYTKTTD